MTHQEILEKAIRKAIRGGWAFWLHEGFADFEVRQPVDMLELLVVFRMGDYEQQVNQQAVIFNHEFAKALWGTENAYFPDRIYMEIGGVRGNKWERRLMEMVISDDPIRYLGEHI